MFYIAHFSPVHIDLAGGPGMLLSDELAERLL